MSTKNKTRSFFERHRESLWMKALKFSFERILLPIAIYIIIAVVGIKYISRPSTPEIESIVAYNTGLIAQYTGVLKLDQKPDTLAWLGIVITNKGNSPDQDLEVELTISGENRILRVQRNYYPKLLRNQAKDSAKDDKRFYERLASFPSESSVDYRLALQSFIKSKKEFDHSVLSKLKNWTKSSQIEVRESAFPLSAVARIFFRERKTAPQQGAPQQTASGSGILVGGYDPVILSNEVFQLVQKKWLISSSDAAEIKTIVENNHEGILLGGINILKFNDILIRKLVVNGKITDTQVNGIIDKAKNAGGILFGGYNIIILEVEVLNALLQNGLITNDEGQSAIDKAKAVKN